MKSTITALAFAAGFAFSASSQAAVTYSFFAPFVAGFDLTVPATVTTDSEFAASSLSDCWVISATCEDVKFYMNAEAAGLGPDPDWEAVAVSAVGGSTDYYYFEAPAFETSGLHPSVYGADYASLTVSSVPEPASLLMICAALPLVWALTRRRRGGAGQA